MNESSNNKKQVYWNSQGWIKIPVSVENMTEEKNTLNRIYEYCIE